MTHDTSDANTDFSRPLAVLKASHEQIRGLCVLLRELAERSAAGEFRRGEAARLLGEFESTARMHHADEEADLLPRMRAAAEKRGGAPIDGLLADVASEHRILDACWSELRAAIDAFVAGGASLDAMLVDRFVKLYRTHIAIEESNLYPLAEMLLSPAAVGELGEGMRLRRRG